MKQPKNQSEKYDHLFHAIDKGMVKVPQFQRDFVWSKAQTAKLIDSILKGYPIGTFILWKTKERLRHMRNIGNIDLPEPDSGDAVLYVLDGQQRITSLYAVRKGARITRDGEEVDYKDICIDLTIKPGSEDEVVFDSASEGHTCIPVHALLKGSMKDLVKEYADHIDLVSEYKESLERYDFSTVVIDEYPIDVACEVFTRINTGGKELTLFEIMVAKTYDQVREFDLAEKYSELIEVEGEGKDLSSAGYETIPPVTILQCVAAQVAGEIKRQNILRINKNEFIDAWDEVKDGLFASIDYLRSHLNISVSRILPYNSLLIPLTWFFIRKNGHTVSKAEHLRLRQYIYWASLTNRFTSAVETKVAEDLKKMQAILNGKEPDYSGEMIEISADELMWRKFSVGDAYCKAIICLMSEKEPRRFNTDGKVQLDNSWLKAASSKNYHHFFPRAFLKKQGYEPWQSNSIMNIVLVDDYLNKRVIKAKPPSTYIAQFEKDNADLGKTLATHFIGNPESFGITQDDYDAFLRKRAGKISAALTKALNP